MEHLRAANLLFGSTSRGPGARQKVRSRILDNYAAHSSEGDAMALSHPRFVPLHVNLCRGSSRELAKLASSNYRRAWTSAIPHSQSR